MDEADTEGDCLCAQRDVKQVLMEELMVDETS